MLGPIKTLHAKSVEPFLGQPTGASLEEVDVIESCLRFRLPIAYRQYLMWMGRDFNGIFRGSNWFITDLDRNREVLSAILNEVGSPFEVEESHVVFFTHQGYMAAWFDASRNESDPECWYIDDGTTVPVNSGTFTEVLFADMQGLAQCLGRQ